MKNWDLSRLELDPTRHGKVRRGAQIRRKRGVDSKPMKPDLPVTAGWDGMVHEPIGVEGVDKLKAHEVVGKNRGRVGAELGPRDRLEHLFGLASPETAKVPTRAQLVSRIKSKIGSIRRMFSPIEVARVLGSESLTTAVAGLGSEHSHAGWRGEENFLLAAHLARWMEGSFTGATLDDVANSFLQRHPGLADRYKRFDARFVETLQKAYPFMPSWSVKPDAVVRDAADWSSMPSPEALYKSRFDDALTELSKVPLSMKLTDRVADRLAKKQVFAGHNVVMVQHMLGQAHPFVGGMVKAGMDPSKAEFVGVPYQHGPAVKLALERTFGLKVTVGERGDMDGMWQAVCDAIDRAYARHLENHEPILVIDDGGYASKYIATKYKDQQHLFKVVEQTTRGLTEISALQPKFPILNVAGSIGKRLESAKVGESVVFSIKRILTEMASTASHKDVLVVGGGKVGLGVAEAFAADGSRVAIYDPFLTHERRRFLEKKGFRVITDKAEALAKKFLVVGASGHRSIDIKDFAAMQSPVFVASCSSKRIEIDSLGLTLGSTTEEGKLRRILAARVNEQETWHYWMKDGKLITALADTLPVNFQDVNSIPPELIDHTMALMMVGAAAATESNGHGLIDLERGVQFDLQAQLEGLRYKPGTNDIGINAYGSSYFGDRQMWHSIAESPATPPEVLVQLYEGFSANDPMHPTALACLHPEHEVSDDLVDRVIAKGFLPHIALLLQNQYLRGEQRGALIEFLMRSAFGIYEIQAGHPYKDQVPMSLEGHRPIAVEKDERGGWCYTQLRIDRRSTQVDTLAGGMRNTKEAADHLLSQISSLAFSLPDEVFPFRANPFRAQIISNPDLLFDASAAHVHIMRSPSWSSQDLRKVVDAAFGTTAAPVHVVERFQDAVRQLGSERALKYGYDLFEALRQHPHADAYVRERATILQHGIVELVDQRWPLRGEDFWPESILGVPAPEYL